MALLNKVVISAVIFDLDGTLVTSDIDFKGLQDAIGCSVGGDVLSFADKQSDPSEKSRIMSLIEATELEDAENSNVIEGALKFLNMLHTRGYPIAVVTRNSSMAAMRKIEKAGLPIPPEYLITREDAAPKPDPEALLYLANKWELDPANIAYVGDYHFDVDAAHNAGMLACLRLADHSVGSDYAQRADYCFEHYEQLINEFFGNRENAA